MSQASQRSPELARGLLQLARAPLAGGRNRTLYPPEHPTVGTSVNRLCTAIRESSLGPVFPLGITPETLMVEAASADTARGIAEIAALFHDRDLLQLTFLGHVPPEAVPALLRMRTLEPGDRRAQAGPARIRACSGHPSIVMSRLTTKTSSPASRATCRSPETGSQRLPREHRQPEIESLHHDHGRTG